MTFTGINKQTKIHEKTITSFSNENEANGPLPRVKYTNEIERCTRSYVQVEKHYI